MFTPPPENRINIGNNVKVWRQLKNFKQKNFADELEISVCTLSNIENGLKSPTIVETENICTVLEIRFQQILKSPNGINDFNQQALSNNDNEKIVEMLLQQIKIKDELINKLLENKY